MQQIGSILKKFKSDEDKYISQEFQKYGYDLAQELGDPKNISMYIKLAKITAAIKAIIKNFFRVSLLGLGVMT